MLADRLKNPSGEATRRPERPQDGRQRVRGRPRRTQNCVP